MVEEIFKPIEGYPGYYVSNLGRVQSRKRKDYIFLSMTKSRLGYKIVQVVNRCNPITLYVARLVLAAFVGYPADPWLCYAHHKDGDLENCDIENLEWIVCETTAEYNPEKSHRRGVLKPDTTKSRMTESKLNQSQETIQKIVTSRCKTMKARREKGIGYNKKKSNPGIVTNKMKDDIQKIIDAKQELK